MLGFNDDVILRTSSLVHGVKNNESGGESYDKICSSTVVSGGGILLANDGPMLVKKIIEPISNHFRIFNFSTIIIIGKVTSGFSGFVSS